MEDNDIEPRWSRRFGRFLVGRADATDGKWVLDGKRRRLWVQFWRTGVNLIVGRRYYALYWSQVR